MIGQGARTALLLALEFAITNYEKFGIWGGTSERERRRMRRARAVNRAGAA